MEITRSVWIRYTGPRGGRGWKNTETREIAYMADPDSWVPPDLREDKDK